MPPVLIHTTHGWLRADPLRNGGLSLTTNDGRTTITQLLTPGDAAALRALLGALPEGR